MVICRESKNSFCSVLTPQPGSCQTRPSWTCKADLREAPADRLSLRVISNKCYFEVVRFGIISCASYWFKYKKMEYLFSDKKKKRSPNLFFLFLLTLVLNFIWKKMPPWKIEPLVSQIPVGSSGRMLSEDTWFEYFLKSGAFPHVWVLVPCWELRAVICQDSISSMSPFISIFHYVFIPFSKCALENSWNQTRELLLI